MGKAAFTLLLFYNFHGMSYLIASSIYQVPADDMLGGLDVLDAGYMDCMYQTLVTDLFAVTMEQEKRRISLTLKPGADLFKVTVMLQQDRVSVKFKESKKSVAFQQIIPYN